MAGAAAFSKGRLLAFYALVWLLLLAGGAGGLIALRQWGWARIEDQHARTAFAETRETFDRGDFIRAQKNVVRLIEAKPERLNLALATFDADALGMPSAAEAIANSVELSRLPVKVQLRHAIVFQGAEAALDRLTAMSDESKADRDVALWHAQLLLQTAKFGDAIERFDAYWNGYPDERSETIERLTPRDADLFSGGASAADRLFNLGLWDEAAEVAAAAQAAGADDPGLGFYTALIAERDEGRAAAIEGYERVLEALPNHELALRRVLALSQQNW